MPKVGDIVVLQMAHANDNEPCAAIVTKAADDGTVDVTAFPSGLRAPVPLSGIPASSSVDETFTAYDDGTTTDRLDPAAGNEGEGSEGGGAPDSGTEGSGAPIP